MEVKKAVPKEESRPGSTPSQRTKKVFLGGLSPETTKDDVYEAFQNEAVEEVLIMTHKETEKPRGFGFIIFKDYDAADRVCTQKHFRIKVRPC